MKDGNTISLSDDKRHGSDKNRRKRSSSKPDVDKSSKPRRGVKTRDKDTHTKLIEKWIEGGILVAIVFENDDGITGVIVDLDRYWLLFKDDSNVDGLVSKAHIKLITPLATISESALVEEAIAA